ncbi:hypothetical protein TGPRC2_313650 [Toxoplasma gondii TgCatPRC2]|uniref:Transmembrane protein n=15 Tax=Toxoplasma gondii TaxID=5811 RepID=A0A125YMA3_TOXGV|nr:hypothetical protein TGME49_313650 [Toxoplasma gondii ME49]EPR61264.1 hypothetical protein TGGT1_313650 [Toxoplasma gondii GT1]ESS35167.1 hypothetical protein TGVEG_313650 [Toxoplasma gondii VEG]KAF4639506.1 hypothetical protein TGRH88_052780 [Toxoplasma gondii]KFG37515.1 hypothetical protein TGDOM2_313650 [Toxoplasma gondii GAB2-2007-GAL-DOM2]KFG49990.1 hypothetical protein TGP89_313650 [Toxoplasma gondii p89]KFG56159.1 hypothetical protein TGFOU_313650 [Toxoplasma gondii FOU]KFG66146.1 |eukprot:XP_018635411.1 hypothetical protein TGME49_313650 [Toxoplasma gondii ME49]
MRELHIIGLAVLWTSNCVSSGFAQRQDPYLRGRVPPLPSSRQYSPFDLARQRLDNPPPPACVLPLQDLPYQPQSRSS